MKKCLVYVLVFIILLTANAFGASYVVKQGDTLSGILSDRYNIIEVNSAYSQIKKLYPAFVLRTDTKIFFNKTNVIINASADTDIIIFRNETEEVSVTIEKHKKDIMTILVKGVITTNLFDAVRKAGEDMELAVMLAGIFEWEIDFFKDLRRGDKFAVLVEKKFINDKYAGYGKIIAADFYNHGKVKRAIYYEEGKTRGYFDENGKSLERGFLRVPINYAKITSRFSDNRLHPVLKENRPHYGIDYAASIGTPVMVTASGTIETMSYTKSNGNYVAVKHNNGYKTFYLHLNGFNKALKKGSSVNQGQIIGYVGKTGYATGPHLDYRISKNGSWLNPLTFIAAPTILNKQQITRFAQSAENNIKVLERAFPIYAQATRFSAPIMNLIFPIEHGRTYY